MRLLRELAFYLLVIAGVSLLAGPFEKPAWFLQAPDGSVGIKVSDLHFETTGTSVTAVSFRLAAPVQAGQKATVRVQGHTYPCVLSGAEARCPVAVEAEALTTVEVVVSG